VNITLNGDARAIPDGLTVDGLLRHLGLESKKIAVERNLEIVPKSAFRNTAVSDGDRLEIVHFIGGG
jgi:thiamine biosynthesis protein ThiS